MTQEWRNTSFPVPTASDDFCDRLTDIQSGIESAVTLNAGSADPSTGGSWGANQVGAMWVDTTTALKPLFSRWELLTGSTYGWRVLCLHYKKRVVTPSAITFSPASPYTADQAVTDIDLTTLLDAAGFQDNDDKVVTAVKIRVTVVDTGTLGTGTSNATWVAFNQKGSTDQQYLYCQVSGVVNAGTMWVGLDSSEVLQFSTQVANTSPSMTVTADVIAFEEVV